jgi:putative membrane protein
MLTHLILTWLISALSIWIVAQIVPGIAISGYGDALIAAIVIAVVNATLGWFLRVLTFPLIFLTLGLFKWVLNAFLLKVAAAFVPGFVVRGFLPALLGSILITVLNEALRYAAFR